MKILLLDIDHTISDAAWRDDMLANRDWDAYHLAGKGDKPIQEICQMVRDLHFDNLGESEGWEVVGLTARPEKWRNQTMKWLVEFDIPINLLLMRPDNDYSSAGESKVKLLKQFAGENLAGLEGAHVLLIDDNDKVIEAMRALNITTLQISVAKRRT